MAWKLKTHDFDHGLGRHYAILHHPETEAEHHIVIYTGHDSCPTCGHVKPKTNTGELDFKAILQGELDALNQSHEQSAAYVKRHNIPMAKAPK